MMETNRTARSEIVKGMLLGILLAPVGAMIGSAVLMGSDLNDPLAPIALAFGTAMYFGSLQVVAILPAALLAIHRFGRPDLARGLLYSGCVLAALNGVLLILNYRGQGYPPI
jgi:hypothetical protein